MNHSVAANALFNPWLLAALGFLAMYAPVYFEASQGIWQKEEHAHGGIILMLTAWMLYQQRSSLTTADSQDRSLNWAAASVLVLGGLLYLLGRLTQFSILEFASQLLTMCGGIWLLGGLRVLKAVWFPVFFLLFMIPLPGSLVDLLTGSLKQWVSYFVEVLLYAADYPIARTGVMLTVGQYRLQVADACSGLHSIFTLAAMGMLLMYLRQRPSWKHNALMLLAIIPIAFTANVIRVIALVLITYHLGDEAGQGFMHGAAGIVLIVVALLAFIGLDLLLVRAARIWAKGAH